MPTTLLGDIRALIESARERAASAVNSGLTMLYWRIGQRIRTQILEGRRADYGKEVLPTLAAHLVKDFGSSFSEPNLRRMVQFAATFPDEQILVSLIRELSWTHFIALIPLKDRLQRDYYAQMASAQRWSVRTHLLHGPADQRTDAAEEFLELLPRQTIGTRVVALTPGDLPFPRHASRPIPDSGLGAARALLDV